jgi:hypothetical protein
VGRCVALVLAAIALGSPAIAHGAVVPGADTRVSDNTLPYVVDAGPADRDLAYDPAGKRYLAVWVAPEPGDQSYSPLLRVLARPLDSAGRPAGPEHTLASAIDDVDGFEPRVTFNPRSGEFLAAWAPQPNGRGQVYVERVGADGAALESPHRISNYESGSLPGGFAARPVLAASATSGDYLVTWDADKGGVEGQWLGPRGEEIGGDFEVAPSGRFPDIAYNATRDEFLVTWATATSPAMSDIWAARVTAPGAPVAPAVQVSQTGDCCNHSGARYPSVAYDPALDEYVIVWLAGRELWSSAQQVYGQRLDAAGAEVGRDDFRISDERLDSSSGAGLLDAPQIAAGPAGALAVLWRDPEAESWSGSGRLYAQSLSAAEPDAPAPDARVTDLYPPGFGLPWITSPALAAGDGSFMALFSEYAWDGGHDPHRLARTAVSLPLGDSSTHPDATIASGPPALSGSRTATVDFHGNADAAGFDCRLDATRWEPCEPPWQRQVSDGRHALEVRARDADGWVDPSPAVHRWVVETGPPETAITDGPPATATERYARFRFESSEDARYECRWDGEAWASCGPSADAMAGEDNRSVTDGAHSFEVRAIDATGAIDPSPARRDWTLDSTGATATIDRAPAARTNHDSATISFHSPEQDATLECSVDFAGWAACQSPLPLSHLSSADHSVRVRARDAAGNPPANEAAASWTVDTTPPDSVISTGPPAVWTDSALFTAFANGYYGQTNECRLDHGDWRRCQVEGSFVRQQYDALAPGEHTFELRASDDLGNADPTPATWTWTVYPPEPRTTITERPGQAHAASDARFAWTADVAGSTFECRLDAGSWQGCDSPYELHGLADGAHELSVRATSPAGEVEANPPLIRWFVYTSDPDTRIVSGPPSPTDQTTANFWFSPSGINASATECRLDGGSWSWCSGSRTFSGLADGDHRFEVQSVDWVGHHDSTPAKWDWTVETGAPQTTITARPPSSSGPSATFSFGSDEDGAIFECSLDGSAFAACSSPTSYAGLATGTHLLKVRAVDTSGLTDLSPAVYQWSVDATPPDTDVAVLWNSASSRTTTISSAEYGSTFECRFDREDWHTCSGSQRRDNLVDGSHVFEARATDRVGNVDPSPARSEFTVDTVPPDTEITSGPPERDRSSSATFEFRSADRDATFECRLQGNGFQPCTSPATYRSLTDGTRTFAVRAVDHAGNTDPTPSTLTWTVATSWTGTSITDGPSEASTQSDATFTFSGRAAVGYECQLDGSGWSDCGSPLSYSGLAEGDHVFEVRGHTADGQRDDPPISRSWTIDTLTPDTRLTAWPRTYSATGSAHFELSSDKADATFECMVDDGGWHPCAASLDLTGVADGRHLLEARAVANGRADPSPVRQTWYVDARAPDTAVDSQIADGLRTSRTDARFTLVGIGLNPWDSGGFMCKVDAGAWGWCLTPLTLSSLADGPHAISVAARDNAGNVDPTPVTIAWTVDTTPADTTIDSAPAGVSEAREGAVSFSSPSADAGYECRIDGGAWDPCESPHAFTGLSDGAHTAEVRAEVAGRFDPTPASASWRVDSTPDTAISSHPPRLSSSSTFTFGSDESGVAFECSVDHSTAWTPCSSGQSFDLPDGDHDLAVRAVDPAAHVDQSPAEWAWTLDRTRPHTTFTSAPSGRRPTTREAFDFFADEPDVVFDCRRDGGAWAPCEPPYAAGGFTDGTHTLDVRATDPAGNVEASPARAQWTVDSAPADTSIVTRPPFWSGSTDASFSYRSTDGATFECRIDRGAWTACGSPSVTYHGLDDRFHRFQVRATDARGEVDRTPAEYQWTVDTKPPQTTIEGGPAAQTDSRDAFFGVVSDDESGRSIECSVDGGSWAACAGPVALHSLGDGWHSLVARAYDAAGNVDLTPATRAWLVGPPPGDPPAGGGDPPSGSGDPPAGGGDPPAGGPPQGGDDPPPDTLPVQNPPTAGGTTGPPEGAGDPPSGGAPSGDQPTDPKPPADPTPAPVEPPATESTRANPPAPASQPDGPTPAGGHAPPASGDLTPSLLEPAPAPGAGAPTTADPVRRFVSRLLRARARTFRHGGLSAVLRPHTVSAPAPGTLTERLYLGRGAKRARLIASGKRSFGAAGARKVSLRAVHLARDAGVTQPVLTIVVAFDPAGAPKPVSASARAK